VLAPTLLGLGVRALIGEARAERARAWTTLASAAALLLLNYANASTALPGVFRQPDGALLVAAVAAAASLPLAGLACAEPLARVCGLSAAGRSAWCYALTMKNTGLALAVAGETSDNQPIAILVILATTLTQRAVAAVSHAWRMRGGAER